MFQCTGRVGEGRQLLGRYAATVSEGMLANTADTGRTEYNTADATLWFLHALGRHVAATGDRDLAAALLPTVDEIVAAHVAGTRMTSTSIPATACSRRVDPVMRSPGWTLGSTASAS
ncbi:MAG: amylo-alpha-1,6-glucosidase, partial [Lapillicoccus sp.]